MATATHLLTEKEATAHPEFREWKWVEPERLPDLIVPFKRDLYARLLGEFADWL